MATQVESEYRPGPLLTKSGASSAGEHSRSSLSMPTLDLEVGPGEHGKQTRLAGEAAPRVSQDSDESDEYLSSEEGDSEGQLERTGPLPRGEDPNPDNPVVAVKDKDRTEAVAAAEGDGRRPEFDSRRVQYDEGLRGLSQREMIEAALDRDGRASHYDE